jgi:uncharacterized protein
VVELLDRNEVLGVLQGFNPWWTGRPAVVPEFRRLAFFVCRRCIEDESLRRAVLLSGPRRVGKTTILNQIATALLENRDVRAICYLSLDHPLLRLLPLPKILKLFHESIHPEGKPTTLLLDEVQYADDWELHVKQLVDHHPEYRILATGSASVVHRQALAESGVGRWLTVPIPTLSFHEFLQIRGETTSSIPPELTPTALFEKKPGELALVAASFRPLMPLFHRYLLVGGFPETARQADISLCQRLLREDVVERVLKRDMAALFRIRNLAELEKLFVYTCLNSGGIFSITQCAKALETTKPTVANHLEALEQANLIYRLPLYGLGGKKVLKARPKVYLVDAALRNAVLLRGEEILSNPTEMGTVVETTILRHLFAYYYQDTPVISYWRDPRGDKEVDIIIKTPAYTLPVEIKYRSTAPLKADSGLAVFCRQESVERACFVTQREEDFGVQEIKGLTTRFLRVPAHIFAFLLGQAERVQWRAPADSP